MKRFREAIRSGKFALTAELTLDASCGADSVIKQGKLLAPVVDAIQVTDNPNAQEQISALAASSLLLNSGHDVVMQMTCRDRNRVALKSDLLGAWAMGVTSLLLMRGDPLRCSAAPDAKAVFDMTGRDLILAAQNLRGGASSKNAVDFLIGSATTVFKPVKKWTPDSMQEKVEIGVRFFQTQPCFDLEMLRSYMSSIVDSGLTKQTYIVVGSVVLPGPGAARWIRDHVRGSVMPDAIIKRLKQAKNPEQEGVTICAELLNELQGIPGIAGANLLTPGDIATIPAAIGEAEILR